MSKKPVKKKITDKERLDWVSRQEEFELNRYDLYGVTAEGGYEYEVVLADKVYVGKTPRKAIDSAIKKERG